MPTPRSPLLFVPGFWHGSWCWSEVLAHVAAAGRPAAAVDLAGHGLHALRPACLSGRPYALEALARRSRGGRCAAHRPGRR